MTTLLLSLSAFAQNPVLALAPFGANTSDAELQPFAAGLTDMLTTDIGEAQGVTLVERARLNDLLAELDLSNSDWADPRSAVALGKGLGATHVVVGGLSETRQTVRLDARVIDVSNGTVVAAVEQEGSVDDVFHLERQLALGILEKLEIEVTPEHRARLGALAPVAGQTGTGFDDAGAPITMTQMNITMPWGFLFVDGQLVHKLQKKVPSTVKVKPGRHEIALATNEKAKILRCWGVVDVPATGINMTTRELCERLQPGPSPYGTVAQGGMLRIDSPIDTGMHIQLDGMYVQDGFHNVTTGAHTVNATAGTPGKNDDVEICRLTAIVPEYGLVIVNVSRSGCNTTEVPMISNR